MYRGSTLSLDDDRIRISTDDVVFPPELDYGRNKDFVKVFIFAYAKLLCDTPCKTSQKPVKVFRKFIAELSNKHVLETIRSFSALYDELVSTIHQTGGESSLRPFISRFSETPIFWEYHHWYMNNDPELFKYISTFLLFGKKLSYTDISFNKIAFRNWVEVEEKLSRLAFADHDMESLATIVSIIVGDIKVDHLLPRHGPGMVADRDIKDISQKVAYLRVNPKLAYAFHRTRPYWSEEMGFGCQNAEQHKIVTNLPARLKFVPKDVTKSRSICMEPVGNMYYQQEVLRWLSKTMSCRPISRFVNMNDQSRNQDAALIGSITCASDTLDLSSASDSVHVDLVKRVFAKTPRLKLLLLATRTSSAETTDGVRLLTKFAPMGSAVCFPVQCIIFTAVCLYSYISHDKGLTTGDWTCTCNDVVDYLSNGMHRVHSIENSYTRRPLPPVVFGDDIIVDARVTDEVIATLVRLGFSVNESKSFRGSQHFRESCGMFALEGQDVTPYRFRVPTFKVGDRFGSDVYASLIDSINNARENRYFSVATYLQSILTEYGFRYRIPFTTDSNAFGIRVAKRRPIPTYDLRYNSDFQITEERVLGVVSRKILPKKVSDHYSMNQWWRSRGRDFVPRDIIPWSRPRPQETRLAPVWSRCEE